MTYHSSTILLLIALFGFNTKSPANAQEDLSELHRIAVNRASEKVAPSIVQIETIGGLETVGDTQTSSAPTTALIVSSDGYALSSEFNFVKIPSAIFARLDDGQRVNVSIVARDKNRKLVLLKLDTDRTFPVPEFALRDTLEVGQTAIALGRAYQHDSINVSTGIISATHRVWSKAVQTDAKISPANYGGPLVNIHGQVIGLLVPLSPRGNDAVAGSEWYDSGIGFAVTLKRVIEKLDILKSGEDLQPGLLGVSFKGTNMYRGQPEISVCPGHSPAGQAGLQPGDVITGIDGQRIIRQAQLRHAIGPMYAGDQVSVTVLRDDRETTVTATLVDKIAPFQPRSLGILPAKNKPGVIIGSIIKDSPAAKAALAPGDRIIAIDDVPVSSVNDIVNRIVGIEIGSEITIKFVRENQTSSTKLNVGLQTGQWVETSAERTDERTVEALVSPIKIPEFANEAFCYLPPRGQDELLGLMVWVPEAGPVNHEALWQQWQTSCEEFGIGLLVPISTDRKRWTPDEEEFIAATITECANRFDIDPSRVAIGGKATGGSMAALVASQNRESLRGLAIIEGAIPRAAASMATDPNLPLFMYFGAIKNSEGEKNVKAIGERMQKNHFPVHIDLQTENPEWPELLARWLNTIDRF